VQYCAERNSVAGQAVKFVINGGGPGMSDWFVRTVRFLPAAFRWNAEYELYRKLLPEVGLKPH
jgi:hypothetical protein